MTITISAIGPSGTNPGFGRRSPVSFHAVSTSGVLECSFYVRLFTHAQTIAGGFNPTTTTPFRQWEGTAGGNPGGYATLRKVNIGTGGSNITLSLLGLSLPSGEYVPYVVALNGNGEPPTGTIVTTSGAWYAGSAFTIDYAVPVPTVVIPAASGTVSSDVPTLGAKLAVGTENGAPTVACEWEVAADSGFSTSLKDVAETVYAAAHLASVPLPMADTLTSGVWYVRARAKAFAGAEVSDWSAYNAFTVAHPASAYALSPSSGQTLLWDSTNTLTWSVSDPSPTDYQTAYEVIVEDNLTGDSILDTGVISSTVPQAVVAIPSGNKDAVLRWKVQLTNRDSVVGDYSDYALFVVSDVPTVSITDPMSGGTVTVPSPEVEWTFSGSGGRTQSQYQIIYQIQSGGPVRLDTGMMPGDAASYTPTVQVFTDGDLGEVIVNVVDSVGLTGSDTDDFTVAFTGPDYPASIDATSDLSGVGYVTVTWTDPGSGVDSGFFSWRIYRRPHGSGPFTLVTDIMDSSVLSYDDAIVASVTEYDYAVVQVATIFGVNLESLPVTVTFTTDGNSYWLLSLTNPDMNVRLPAVKDDTFKDEYDFNLLNLYGRGRRAEYGTHWGKTGTLTAQFRDAPSVGASPGFAALLALKDLKTDLYLRTPFGQIWHVAAEDLSVTRVAGTGAREAVDVAITYDEIADN